MCDTVISIRKGRVFFAKNSDRDANEAQILRWFPAQEHAPQSTVRCTWRSLPQIEKTHAVLLSSPFWMWGAEMGANEHGVVIGNEAVFTNQPYVEEGLLGMDILRLGLERGASAEEAMEVIVDLLKRYGQGGRCGYTQAGFRYHNSFLIADAKGAYVVESAGMKIEVERIVEGTRAISNGLTLSALRPYGDRLREGVAQCRLRRSRVEQLAAEATDARSFLRVLRDHGEGQRWPRYRFLNGAMGCACMHSGGFLAASQSVASWLSELTPEGARHWATGTSAPCLGIFKPISLDRPLDLGQPTGQQDTQSLWWRFEALHRRVLHDPKMACGSFLDERDALEARIFAEEIEAADAWTQADAWMKAWSAWLEPQPLPDRRPFWLRRHWLRQERLAQRSLLPAFSNNP